MRRRLRFGSAQASALVVVIGFFVLLSLLASSGLGGLTDVVQAQFNGVSISQISALFLRVSVVTTAVAILLGVANLFTVHTQRIVRRSNGFIYSIVLLLSFLAGLISYYVDRETSMMLLEEVQVPIESSFAGLLFFTLVYGAYRLMHYEVTWAKVLFFLTILIVLVGSLSLSEVAPISDFSEWLMRIPVTAGGRGILIGIALATVVSGMRILLGQDRSYRE